MTVSVPCPMPGPSSLLRATAAPPEILNRELPTALAVGECMLRPQRVAVDWEQTVPHAEPFRRPAAAGAPHASSTSRVRSETTALANAWETALTARPHRTGAWCTAALVGWPARVPPPSDGSAIAAAALSVRAFLAHDDEEAALEELDRLRALARRSPAAFARAALSTDLPSMVRANAARLAVEALLTAPRSTRSTGVVAQRWPSAGRWSLLLRLLGCTDDALVRLGIVEGLEDAGQERELQSTARVLLQQVDARETDPGVRQSIRIALREIGG